MAFYEARSGLGSLRSRFSPQNWSEILAVLDETWAKCRFFERAQRGVVYFLMAPSIGVVCLVAETRKRVLAEPGIT